MGFFKSVVRAAVGFVTGGLSEVALGFLKGKGGNGNAQGQFSQAEIDSAARKHFGTEPIIGNLGYDDILGLTTDPKDIKDPLQRRIERVKRFEESTKQQLAKFASKGLRPEYGEGNKLKFDSGGQLLSTAQQYRSGFGSPYTTSKGLYS